MPDQEDQVRAWWECHYGHSRSPSPINSDSIARSQPNSRSDPPPESTRSLTWILLPVFCFVGAVLAVIYFLSSPTAPHFAIHSVNGINFQASCPWSIGFSIRNSNMLVKFSYRKITVSVSDASTNVVLSSVEVPPFSLHSKSEIFVVAENSASTAIGNGNVKSSDAMTTMEQQLNGSGPVDLNKLGPGIKVKVLCEVWAGPPVLPIFSQREVNAVCSEVLLSEIKNKVFMNSPRICSSSLSNLW